MADGQRPRVLLVTKNFPPLWGGMEKLNWHMAEQLSRVADVAVIGPRGCEDAAPPDVQTQGFEVKPLSRFLANAQTAAIRTARRMRPDVVLAGSGLTAPLAWLAARLSGAKAVAYVHGLDVAVAHLGYRLVWLPFLRRMDRIISNSAATTRFAVAAGADPAKIRLVHPGVDMPPAEIDVSLRDELGIGARPVLLSVGRLTQRKGLREFVRDVLPAIAAKYPDVLLLVAGDAPTHSLYAQSQTPQSIQSEAESRGIGDNVRFLGVVTDAEKLSAIYRLADVHVFTVREIPNDPEGFGMVALEAAAHGLPTVAYATGGVPEAVAEGKSGFLVKPRDASAFADAVLRLLAARPNAAMRADAIAFAHDFRWSNFGARLTQHLSDFFSHVR